MKNNENSKISVFKRLYHSLGGKTVRSIILVSLLISIAAVSFGFFLYASQVRREYRTNTWQMSKTAAELLNIDEVLAEAKEVIRIYRNMSESEKEQLHDKHAPLLSEFDSIRGEGFEKICETLRLVQNANDGMAAFTAFIDLQTNRRVFIADSDPKASFCPPGSWDVLEGESVADLMFGREYSIDHLYGVGKIPATTINMEPYGYRCMAGTLLDTIDGYPVFVFFDTDMNMAANTSRRFLGLYIVLLLWIMILVTLGTITYVYKQIVKPINSLTKAAKQYTRDRDEDQKANGHFADLEIKTGDEIEDLSNTMKTMETDLGNYIENLTKVTAERERISTELSLANRIQTDMLPNIYPAFPDRPEFDIYGIMDPAKEVGGDFYDFFLVDDDHLCMEIADVSGKGVPAALFMMASKIILANNTMQGMSPSEVLTKTNELICANNREDMFVTVWMGILEISTGKLTCCNAGHEYPVIRHPEGHFEEFKDKHGFIIGGLKNARYKDYEIQLLPGSKIFVYTDGVVEAADADGNLFTAKRMMDALQENEDKAPDQILKGLRYRMDEFVKSTAQFDDITMLCLEYKGLDK